MASLCRLGATPKKAILVDSPSRAGDRKLKLSALQQAVLHWLRREQRRRPQTAGGNGVPYPELAQALRVDRAELSTCLRRLIRKRGVQAMFETPDGRRVGTRRQRASRNLPNNPPGRLEIEAHFHTYERCQSLARAEKDLLVRRALLAMERFRSDRARLAIEGGTALVAYHRATTRFSEDLDIRLIPDESVRRLPTDERIAVLKEIGQEFKEHVHAEMPYLEPTRKGRIRKDAVLQTFIYNYRSTVPDERVVAGIKCELVHIPLMMPTVEHIGVTGAPFDAIHVPEIAGVAGVAGARLSNVNRRAG